MKLKPFFINSNICANKGDVSTFDNFMKAIAYNTGNSYITYSLIKELLPISTRVDLHDDVYLDVGGG